ncbi:MAG: hypothetical protein IM638_07895 [Bacteroidetes bacterium]|nr:hypothetical protein [Bacteroidota bacterium]
MVLLIILTVACSAVFLIQHIYLKSIYNRQVVEARFRMLHSEATMMLFDGVFSQKNLSPTDLIFLRKIIDRLSSDIHQLKANRKNYFTLFNYLRFSIEGIRNEESQTLAMAHDKDVVNLQRKAGDAMAMAFRAFVPWLRFRILYLLMKVGLYLLVLIGLDQFRGIYEQLLSLGRHHSGRLG